MRVAVAPHGLKGSREAVTSRSPPGPGLWGGLRSASPRAPPTEHRHRRVGCFSLITRGYGAWSPGNPLFGVSDSI